MKFEWQGRTIQHSTRCTNEKDAVRVESSFKAKLARAGTGLERDPRKNTTLADFRKKFEAEIASTRGKDRPDTIDYYSRRHSELLRYIGFERPLDEIDENTIDAFVRWKLAKKSRHGRPYSRASVNHCLRTLKRALRLAYRWRHIDRLPQISVLSGERVREEVMPPEREPGWLELCPEPLKTFWIVATDASLRLKEYLNLGKSCCVFERDPRNPDGYIQVRDTGHARLKTHWSNRDVPITPRVRAILQKACAEGEGDLVFPGVSKNTLEDQLRATRDKFGTPGLVLHSARHSFGTASARQVLRLRRSRN